MRRLRPRPVESRAVSKLKCLPPADSSKAETPACHGETREPPTAHGKSLSLAVSLISRSPALSVLWRQTCILPTGTLSLSVRYLCIAPIGSHVLCAGTARGDVKRSTGAPHPELEQGCAELLARFFPQAVAVRVPVQVTALRGGSLKLREAAVLEFGAPDFAIFVSTLPLEFDDRVRLERSPKGRASDATVIAVQYHDGRKAVAVKFAQRPCEWVTQP
jgi:hypothetical protein